MKINILIILMLVAIAAYSESITIKQKSGNETILELSTNPIIFFRGEDMIIANDFTTFIIPIDDVDNYVVRSGLTGIQKNVISPKFLDGHIVFDCLKSGSIVSVYNVGGRVVSYYIVDEAGYVNVDITNLPQGIYIINTPNNSIKVIYKKGKNL